MTHFRNECPCECHEETQENLKRWSLADSTTTTNMRMNEEIFHDIEKAEDPSGMISIGGELDSDCTAEMNGAGRMTFNQDGMANSFGMKDFILQGFQV